MSETYYRPGLIFLSRYPGYQLALWREKYFTYPDGQRELVEPPGVADFGLGLESSDITPVNEKGEPVAAPTSPVIGMDGYHQTLIRADIRGGAFDLDLAAEQFGWSDEQKETAARRLLQVANDPAQPDVWLFEPKSPEPPWPTYDTMTNYLEIASFAEKAGLIAEALSYEIRTKNRQGVIDELAKRQRQLEDEQALTAA